MDKITELIQKLQSADKAYYENHPEISDEDYDNLYFELVKLHQEDPHNQDINDYLNSIPERLTENTFEGIHHPRPVLSLDKVRTDDSVKGFIEEWNHDDEHHTDKFIVQHKEDGLSVILYFNMIPGRKFVAATRGGGYEGKDITNSVYQFKDLDIDDILSKLDGKQMSVRGEAIILDNDFAELNKDGQYMNSRNLASGTLMQKDPKVVGQRRIHLLTYTILSYSGQDIDFDKMTELDELHTLESYGFETTVSKSYDADDLKGILSYIDSVDANREQIGHAIDGLVIKPNITEVQKQEIGNNPHGPNYQVAYKFSSLEQVAKLANVRWQVSANGKLTPVGILDKPVNILGSQITKASLASIQNIEQRDLMVGDTVVIARSNDVIPQIRSSIKDKRDGTQIDIHTLIPFDAVRIGAILYLDNHGKKSHQQLLQLWNKFVGKPALDIDGLSFNTIVSLADNDVIDLNDFSSLWHIKKADFIDIDGLGEKRYEKLQSELIKAKETPLNRVFLGLSIRGLGGKLSMVLSESIGDMKPYLSDHNASDKEKSHLKAVINNTSGYGQDAFRVIDELFADETLSSLRSLSEDAGLELTQPQPQVPNEPSTDKLDGAKIVITGKTSVPRKQLAQVVIDNGGINQPGIKSDTDYLLSATTISNSRKFKTAREKGITIISEDEFKSKFGISY